MSTIFPPMQQSDIPIDALGPNQMQPYPSSQGAYHGPNPIDFDQIPKADQDRLGGTAENLINRHADSTRKTGGGAAAMQRKPLPILDYHDMGDILKDLKASRTMTDQEKAFVWSKIADAKGSGDVSGGWLRTSGTRYYPSIEGANPRNIDSDPLKTQLRAGNTPNHTHVGFEDTHHGFGEDDKYENKQWAMKGADQVESELLAYEKIGDPIWENPGDYNASQSMVAAFHAYRDAPEGHRFESFANVWLDRMIAK